MKERTIRRTDYLYAGFHDSPRKLTGDAYRALFGLGANKMGKPNKAYRPKIKVKEETIKLVESFIKSSKNTHELMTLKEIAEAVGLSGLTVNRAIIFLEKEGRIKIIRNHKTRMKGRIYE